MEAQDDALLRAAILANTLPTLRIETTHGAEDSRNSIKQHVAFREAAVALFRKHSRVGSRGTLPFIVRVDDQHGDNLLYAKIVATPDGLVCL